MQRAEERRAHRIFDDRFGTPGFRIQPGCRFSVFVSVGVDVERGGGESNERWSAVSLNIEGRHGGSLER